MAGTGDNNYIEGDLEIKMEESMDVLIIEVGAKPIFLTLPTTSNPFDFFFGDSAYVFTNGHFAFLLNGQELGLSKNIRIGVNPLFANIHGPIVYAHSYASLTADEVEKIVGEMGFDSYLDAREFKERPAYQAESISKEELVSRTEDYLFRLDEHTLTPDKVKHYFVEGYDELSLAVYRIVTSFHGFFIMGFLRDSGWNPVEKGLNTKDDLIAFASSIPKTFDVFLERKQEAVRTGKETRAESIDGMSSINVLVEPIREELKKLAN